MHSPFSRWSWSPFWIKGNGFFIQNATITTVNLVTGAIGLYYVLTFYSYTLDEKFKVKSVLICTVAGFLAVVYHIYFIATETARLQMGIISNTATVFMFASPLTTMISVIQTKDASSIPILLSIASFACSTSWFLYGVTLQDYFVMIPNGLGIALSSLQLFLVKTYGQKRKEKAILPMTL